MTQHHDNDRDGRTLPPGSHHDPTGAPPPTTPTPPPTQKELPGDREPVGPHGTDRAVGAPPGDRRGDAPLGPETRDGSGSPRLGPDSSVREIARAARAAFLGTDLIQSGPTLWPFGRRAQARREHNRQATEQARRRRAQFREAFDAHPVTAPPPARRRPIDRRTNALVIAALAGLALAVVAGALVLGAPDPRPITQPGPSASPPTTAAPASRTVAVSATPTTGTVAVPAQPPIPSGGVAPITPGPATTVDPGSIVVVDPPAGDPTPTELATPEDAMRAWLARLCPFQFSDPFGTAERRARPAMTDTGWSTLDPGEDARARASWNKTVAARESGRCAQPTALVSPEAPRSPTTAIVIGSATRVVTAEGQRPYVEQLTQVRIVRRGSDGLWRVDLPTEGG